MIRKEQSVMKLKYFNLKIILPFFFLILMILLGYSFCREENVRSEFKNEQLVEDFDYLWGVLENEYIFLPVLEERSIDIDNIRRSTREQIIKQKPDIELYYNLLDEMFAKMDYFAHLSLVDWHNYKIYKEHYNSEESPETEWKNVLQNHQTKFIYEQVLSKRNLNYSNVDFSDIEGTYYENQKVLVFRIKSFDPSFLNRNANFISNYIESLGAAQIDHIVFDITGNIGGSDLVWRENIVKVFGGDYEWKYYLYLRNTELMKKYYKNFDVQLIRNQLEQDKIPLFCNQLGLTDYYIVEDEISGILQVNEEAANAKRWVLIDNKVYSAADSFASFCKMTGWATLVGTTTKGDGMGITPLLITLPNTGLLMRFSGTASANEEGNLNAIYGTIPEYYSTKWENPFSTFLRIIE